MHDLSHDAASGEGGDHKALVTAVEWIRRLALVPHPEGGYFRETYRAGERIEAEHLPLRYGGPRAFATAIYFLLTGDQVSALHRVRSDEMWHFYTGGTLTLSVIDGEGSLTRLALGPRGPFQAVVPALAWFGAEVDDRDEYALVGCTVAPGFDFADFELGERAALLRAYPRHRAVIERLTRFSA